MNSHSNSIHPPDFTSWCAAAGRPLPGSGSGFCDYCRLNQNGKKLLAAIHKKSFIVLFFCLFTLMMATDHLFLYNKRTALNDWKPPENANISNKVKTTCELHCFAFLFSCLFCLTASGLNSKLGTKLCQSTAAFWVSVQLFSVWMEVGSWVLVLVRSGVRCGWVGARGWMVGCSPPSPWWSSGERTACWGTGGTNGQERETTGC